MVIVSLTTTPPNMFSALSAVDRLLHSQTVPPNLVVVNVCDKYNRFKSNNISLSLSSASDKVLVNHCVDSGPATKVLGLIESGLEIDNDDIIIVLDDDILYPSRMVEEYISTLDILKSPHETILGVVGNSLGSLGRISEEEPVGLTEWTEQKNTHLKKVNVLQGWGSICFKGAALEKLKDIYSIHHFPNEIFYQDDLFTSNIANKYFDLRIVQTEHLWHHRSVRDTSKLDMPVIGESNPNLRPSSQVQQSLQMHNDTAISGMVGDDGNLEKNLRSLALYIKKNILNLDMKESRKKELVFHDFINKFGSRLQFKDIEDISLEQCIDTLDSLEKHCLFVGLMYDLMKIKERENDTYVNGIIELLSRHGLSKGISKFLDRLPYVVRKRKNMKAAVIFHFAIDGKHGCHTRAMKSIKALVSLGMEVHLLTQNINGGKDGYTSVWTESDAENMQKAGVKVLDVFDQPPCDYYPVGNNPSWSKHVEAKIKANNYDFIFVNYEEVLTEKTYRLISNYPCAIDTHDNINFNGEMQDKIDTLNDIDECRRFYSNQRSVSRKRKYAGIPRVYISQFEYETFRLKGDVFIPYAANPSIKDKSFLGNPVFLGSDNLFNRKGVDILDEIISSSVSPIDIFGSVSNHANQKGNENIIGKGYVENIAEVFRNAAFSVCPLILGTGSKIKIQDSLANATPVISMIDSGLYSDIIHGVNGFLCYNKKEFKEYFDLLYNDRQLCSKMGKAAAEINEKKSRNAISFEEYFEILIRVKSALKGNKNAR